MYGAKNITSDQVLGSQATGKLLNNVARSRCAIDLLLDERENIMIKKNVTFKIFYDLGTFRKEYNALQV